MAKQLIALAVILAIIVGILVAKELLSDRPTIEDQVRAVALTPGDYTVSAVTRLEIASPEDPERPVALQRDGAAWIVESLYNAPADAAKVEAFLSHFKNLRGELRAEGADVLDAFAIGDDAALRLKVYTDGDAPAFELLVGRATHRDTFARLADTHGVYRILASVNLRNEVGLSGETGGVPESDHWLLKQIAEVDTSAVTGIELHWPDKALAFEKKIPPATGDNENGNGDGAEPVWTLTAGGPGEAPEAIVRLQGVRDLVSDLDFNLRAETAVDPANAAEWGMDSPGYRVTITGGAEPLTLAGTRPRHDGPGYVRVEGRDTIYRLSPGNFGRLFPAGTRFFDLEPYAERPKADAIDGISIEREGLPLQLRRGADGWSALAPDKLLAPKPDAMRSLTGKLAGWRPADYADGPPDARGLTSPFATITFRHGDDGQTATLRLGDASPVAGGRYAQLDGGGPIFTISDADVRALAPPLRDVFVDQLIEIEAGAVTAFEVQGAERPFRLEQREGLWYLRVGDTQVAADAGAVGQLSSRLALLRADDYVKPEPIAKPVTLIVERADADPLTLTADVESGRVSLPERDVDFKVSPPALQNIVIDPDVLKAQMPDAEEDGD